MLNTCDNGSSRFSRRGLGHFSLRQQARPPPHPTLMFWLVNAVHAQRGFLFSVFALVDGKTHTLFFFIIRFCVGDAR